MPNKSIILVEDDRDISHLLQFLLTREGYTVIPAYDGLEAETLLNNCEKPNLVILDHSLPFKSGYQILQHIRITLNWDKVPVILLTANKDEHNIVKTLEAGADDYLLKPFQPPELLARIKRYVNKAA